MASKLLVIIATGDKEKALSGLMYAHNAIKYRWLNSVKVVFFGPSERLVANDEELTKKARDIAALTDCFACKAISDKQGVTKNLTETGVKVEYVGDILSNLIKEDYLPMVW